MFPTVLTWQACCCLLAEKLILTHRSVKKPYNIKNRRMYLNIVNKFPTVLAYLQLLTSRNLILTHGAVKKPYNVKNRRMYLNSMNKIKVAQQELL
jgi:hypothetical protein